MKNLISIFLFLLPTATATATTTVTATKKMMQEVYVQLKSAIGDTKRTFPTLEIRPGANSVLAYNKRKNIIFVDEKALEVCQSFGEKERDAFAFLLAHEMTHFYQEHHWQEAGFATSFLTDKENFETHVADEKEADLFGAFITHLAGFQSVKIAATIFDKVYTAYGLTENLSDYPTLQQRKATALEVCEKVSELIRVFETANYLNLLGEYTSAAAAYEYVLQFVQYKELYNNIGASLVAAAALQVEYSELAFHYPIELDLDIPLRDGADTDKADLLQKAIEYLTFASQMDNRHYATFINLACAYTLNQQIDKAIELISQLKTFIQQDKQLAEIAILEGIIKAKINKKEAAINFFNLAKTKSQEAGIQQLATYNEGLLIGKSPMPAHYENATSFREKIGGIDLTYQNDFPFKEIIIPDNFSYEEKVLGFYDSPKASLMHLQTEEKTLALLITNQKKQTLKKGIAVGATFEQLQQVFPTTTFKILNHSKGYFLLLATQKLLFNFDNNNRVMEWGIYTIY